MTTFLNILYKLTFYFGRKVFDDCLTAMSTVTDLFGQIKGFSGMRIGLEGGFDLDFFKIALDDKVYLILSARNKLLYRADLKSASIL